jgi:hypothetical protein
MSDFNEPQYGAIEEGDVIEMILSRYNNIDLDEFVSGEYDPKNMCKFSWNREEICLLANRFHKENCMYSYYAIYHDLMILYMYLMRGKTTMDVRSRGGSRSNTLEDDILNEFPIILDSTIKDFNIIENYSLKSFFKKRAENYIRSIRNKDRKERLVGKTKTRDDFNQAILSIDEDYVEEYLPILDVEQAILGSMIEENAKEVIRICIRKKYFKVSEFEMFCRYYGLLGEGQMPQKDIAKKYKISVPSVSLKIKKVREILSTNPEIKKIGELYGIGV